MNAEKQKCIISIGLTIHSCPVEVREKMAVPEVRTLLPQLGPGAPPSSDEDEDPNAGQRELL